MQITLVQTEVEQALRDYVANRLTLAEGTTFSIELAATRGEKGITATIELIEPPKAGQVAAIAVKTTVKTPAPAPAPSVTEKPAPVAEQLTQQATETAADSAQATGEGQPQADSQEAASDPKESADAQQEAAPVGKSLFGGLKRPVNS